MPDLTLPVRVPPFNCTAPGDFKPHVHAVLLALDKTVRLLGQHFDSSYIRTILSGSCKAKAELSAVNPFEQRIKVVKTDLTDGC